MQHTILQYTIHSLKMQGTCDSARKKSAVSPGKVGGQPVLSALQLFLQFRHNIPQAQSVAVLHNVGVLLIQRAALIVQIPERPAGLNRHAAGMKVAQPLGDVLARQAEVDDRADAFEVRHGFRTIDDAAARGDDAVLHVDAGVDAVLNVAKAIVAVLLNELGEGCAHGGLDDEVGIDKIHAEGLGENDPDGGFAAAGHPDEDDVAHEKLLPTSALQKKRPSGAMVAW